MQIPAKFRFLTLIALVALMGALPTLASAKQARAGASSITYAEFSGTTPIPSGTIKSTGGGDGYNVFFDNAGHVFNIYHHNSPAKIDCHTVAGDSCGAAWPFDVAPYNTGFYSSGWVDNTNHKLWFPTNSATSSGFGCVDLANAAAPAWCGGGSDAGKGYIEIPGTVGTSGGFGDGVGAVAVNGTRIFSLMTGAAGKHYIGCLDMATSLPCAGTSTFNLNAAAGMDAGPVLLSTGDYIYVAMASAGYCVVASTMAECSTAWGDGSRTITSPSMAYLQPDSAGAIEGVCFHVIAKTASDTASCYKPDGSDSTVTTNADLAKALVYSGYPMWFPPPQTTGTRVYYGDAAIRDPGKVGCFDVATKASCTGWPVDTSAYAITLDPNTAGCVWTNNDGGQIRSFNANGTPGCSAGSAVTTAFAPTLPCASGTIASWNSFALTAPAATGYTAATLTVKNAAGAVVKSGGKTWSDVKITGAKRTLDLSGLAVKDTGTAPTFTVSYTGLTATGDATASLVMGVRKAAGCTKTVTVASPFVASTSPSSKKKKLRIGDRTTITLKARNGSTVTSRGTKFVMRVPKGFRVVSAPGGKITGRTVTWTIGNLKSKKSAERSVVLQAIGRGRHGIDFRVISSNLVAGTGTASTIDVLAGPAPAVTG